MKTQEAEVLFERIGEHIAVVTLNRPNKLNAINGNITQMLEKLVIEIEADTSIRVVVLASNGRAFCVGADLREVAAGRHHELERPETGFAGFIYAQRSKPWIAAVQGPALGGGTEISLACDMIVAGENASFALPEVKLGIIAGAAGAYRITRVLPRPLAIEMITTGEPLTAQRAYEVNFVNRLVKASEELAEALKLAKIIAANSPISVRETLRVTRYAADSNENGIRNIQQQAIERVLSSPDFIEGPQAFIEKRPPVWKT